MREQLRGHYPSGYGLEKKTYAAEQGRPRITVGIETVEQARITAQASEIEAKLTAQEAVDWDAYEGAGIRAFLKKTLQTKKKVVYSLREEHLHEKYRNIGGNNLDSLWQYAETHPERGEKTSLDFLIDRTDMVEEIVDEAKDGKRVFWKKANKRALRQFLTKAAEELDPPTPVSLLKSEDLHSHHFDFINSRRLHGLLRFGTELNAEQKGKTVWTTVREYVGIRLPTREEVLSFVDNGGVVSWEDIISNTAVDLFRDATQEQGKKVYEITRSDIYAEYMDPRLGKVLKRIYNYAETAKDRGKRTPLEYLQEKMASGMVEDVIKEYRDKDEFDWSNIPTPLIREILKKAAVRGKKVYALKESDLRRSLKFLKYKTLDSLVDYAQEHPEREDTDAMGFLFDKTNMVDEVIGDITSDRIVSWETMHPRIMHSLLTKVAQTKTPPHAAWFVISEDLDKKGQSFLEGKKLHGLYRFGRELWRKQDTDKSVMAVLMEYAGIKPPTTEELLEYVETEGEINWHDLPPHVYRGLLEAALSNGKKIYNIHQKTEFMAEYEDPRLQTALRRLYYMALVATDRGEMPVVDYILQKAEAITVLIEDITAHTAIDWHTTSKRLVSQVLEIAGEELDKPKGAVTETNLVATHFEAFGGATLSQMVTHFKNLDTYVDQATPPIHKIRQYAEIPPNTANDVIWEIRNERKFDWGTIPDRSKTTLLDHAGDELDLFADNIGTQDLRYSHFAFLGGHTLESLHEHYVRREGQITMPAIAALKTETENEHSIDKDSTRSKLMEDLFKDTVTTRPHVSADITTKKLLAFARQSAYNLTQTNPYLEIDRRQLAKTIFDTATDVFVNGHAHLVSEIVTTVHRDVEEILADKTAEYYRNQTEMITGPHDGDAVIFHAGMHTAIEGLPMLHRRLVEGISVRRKTFAELVPDIQTEFGIQTNQDYLQEMYEDALVLMRDQLALAA